MSAGLDFGDRVTICLLEFVGLALLLSAVYAGWWLLSGGPGLVIRRARLARARRRRLSLPIEHPAARGRATSKPSMCWPPDSCPWCWPRYSRFTVRQKQRSPGRPSRPPA